MTGRQEAAERLAQELAEVVGGLQRSTVQVRGPHGPGGGSGVIWSADGTIITNAHVARGERAAVELADGRTFEAQVTARDDRRDLAALRIVAGDLPAAPVGDSDALRVGQFVVAVGHPFGVVGAATTGIIHTLGGAAPMDGRQSWVQADVRLAPGNSGGPLADALGRVIGVNSMIAGGLALAVPSNAVARFLRAQGQRPYLGVSTRPVTMALQGVQTLGLLVLEVAAGSPAHVAGLITGDVLVGAAGQRFSDPADLTDALRATDPGQPLDLEMVRAGVLRPWQVTVGDAAPAQARAA